MATLESPRTASDEFQLAEYAEASADTVPKFEDTITYFTGSQLWLTAFTLCLGGFLVSLDSTILGTAVTIISDDFHSLRDIGWYSSVYFLTACTPQLLLVKVNAHYPIRWSYTAAMMVFIVGSAVCGAAPNSSALIAGRALAGLGTSGILVASASLVPFLAPPSQRPTVFGLFAGSIGLGVGSGPLIGGVFTEEVTWRWNFYMNVPFGAFIYIIFFFSVRPTSTKPSTPLCHFLKTLDLFGLATLTPSIGCLLIALQWGGTTYPWGDGRIIALLVLFVTLIVAFVVNEAWKGDSAMLPARVFTNRSVIGAVLFCLCSNGAYIVLIYYLPIWFQGVQGDSPIQSAAHTLPLVITTVVIAILGGLIITVTGHVGPFMVIGSIFTAVGAGLLTTLDIDATTTKSVGYQIIFGLGVAFIRQSPTVCVQNALAPEDVLLGYTIITSTLFISGAIFVSAAQDLFIDELVSGLQGLGISRANAIAALVGGVNALTNDLSGDTKTAVLHVLNQSIVHAWRLPVILCCISIIGALAVEHSKVKGKIKG